MASRFFDKFMQWRTDHEAVVQANGDAIQSTWDAMVAANTPSAPTGVSLSDAAAAAQATADTANAAHALSQSHAAILAVRDNNPLYNSLDSTAEVTFPFVDAVSSGGIASTIAYIGFICISEAKTIGRIDANLTSSGGTLTGFFINVYQVNTTTGALTKVYTTPDLKSQIPTSASNPQWVTDILSGASQFAVAAGDVLAVEGVFTQTGGVGIYYPVRNIGSTYGGMVAHPTLKPKMFAAQRNPTGNLSPASLAESDLSWFPNCIVPYYSLGVSGLPATYQPDMTTTFTTAGSHTYTIPSWMVAGDELDCVALGAGGAGAPSNIGTAPGGSAGAWQTQTLVCGTDFPVGGGTISIVIGSGGVPATAFHLAGGDGQNTTYTYTDPGSTPHTVTATGGAGGPAGSAHADQTGMGAYSIVFNGQVYFGGGDQRYNKSPGNPPGGGGRGGGNYQLGYAGAPGGAWFTTRQQL